MSGEEKYGNKIQVQISSCNINVMSMQCTMWGIQAILINISVG